MRRPISTRDAEVLNFIVVFTAEMGYPPTVREIGRQLGMSSPSTVQSHIVALKNAGYIVRGEEGSPRTIRVLKTDADASN